MAIILIQMLNLKLCLFLLFGIYTSYIGNCILIKNYYRVFYVTRLLRLQFCQTQQQSKKRVLKFEVTNNVTFVLESVRMPLLGSGCTMPCAC
jgi:hypothetical protein